MAFNKISFGVTIFSLYLVQMDQSAQNIKNKAYKVIIVGPQNVGKSSILYRLSQQKFNSAYESTVGIDFKTYKVQLDHQIYSLQIWDTAGQQKFRSLTSTYYKGSHACICIFDLSQPSTLEKCDYYVNKAMDENIAPKCVYLVGNKNDIEGVSSKQGEAMADNYNISYSTCSAKTGEGVIQLFNKLGRNLVETFGNREQSDGQSLKPKVSIQEKKGKCC